MRRTLTIIALIIITFMNYACKEKKKTVGPNPFFAEWTTPFGVPPFGEIEPEHYLPAIEEGIRRHNAEIDSIVANPAEPTFDNVIAALDASGELLSTAYTVFSLVGSADSNEQLQEIDLKITPMVSAHGDEIYLNGKLFDKVKSLYDRKDALGLDGEQMRLLEKTYKGFVRAGIMLPEKDKERLKEINRELSEASVRFGNNLLAENKDYRLVISAQDKLQGLPMGVVAAAKERATAEGMDGKWAFTLGRSSMTPFLTYADDRELRKELYTAYINQGNHDDGTDNKELVRKMVRLRAEKARLLGFDSYSAFVLDNNMAKTPEKVYGLLDRIWTPALKAAEGELEEMSQIKKRETGDDSFEAWDWWYYAEKLRKQKYNLKEEMIRPYFSLSNVQAGIFELANRLYGITFRPIVAPVYNNECTVYEVMDRDNSHLGVLYMDFFPRDGKRSGAWCGRYRSAHVKDGKRVYPVVTVVANFTRPDANGPSLLSLDETRTFFHEFGHALHSLFTTVKYEGLNRVERDFVELPSQIMENWAFEPEMLRKYAKHYASGAIIPDNLVNAIGASSLFNQGFETTELVAAALLDMDVHGLAAPKDIDVNAFEAKAMYESRGLIGEIAPRYRLPYFRHIFDGGYAAGYYGYIWAEVLDKDAYQAFKESGDIFNPDLALSFRKNILEKGGSSDGMDMYVQFRGKEPGVEPLMISRGFMKAPEKAAGDKAPGTESGNAQNPDGTDGTTGA